MSALRTYILSITLGSAVPGAAHAEALRDAVLKLYPGHASATLLVQVADECAPANRLLHAEAFERWQQTQQLAGYRNLIEKSLGARDAQELLRQERDSLLPKMRSQFPNCVTAAKLQETFRSARMDLRATHPDAHRTVQAALSGGGAITAAAPVHAPRSQPTPTVSAHANLPALEGIYLDQTTAIGSAFRFSAYAVFSDGTLTNDLNTAFGGGRGRTGRWERHGNGFAVKWDNGKRETLSGKTFYRTFPADAGDALSGKYVALSTGGNIPFGGNVMTFSASTIVFNADGTFSSKTAGGGSTPNTVASSNQSGQGRYALNGHTITLHHADGRTTVTGFYFFPAHGLKTNRSIGIGNKVYSLR
jgi:hypothetical protein